MPSVTMGSNIKRILSSEVQEKERNGEEQKEPRGTEYH